jgi:phosphoinositide-3-kinase regulatory subunit 4
MHLTKLQQLGMTPSDESKLLAMREYILKLANATSSFASRLNYEPDTGHNLKIIGSVEFQKLGVVPQTVFLKARNADLNTRSSRLPSIPSRRSVNSPRTPILSPSRLHKVSMAESSSTGAPFEDLRRRLATINGSTSSLSVAHNIPRDLRNTSSPMTSSTTSLLATPTPERPGSPSESIVSTTNSVSFQPSSRLHVGSTDGQKAAPAVGSSKTNAIGLLDAHSKMRLDGSPDESGRSSPMSMSMTLRGPRITRPPSLLAISTYGTYLTCPF